MKTIKAARNYTVLENLDGTPLTAQGFIKIAEECKE